MESNEVLANRIAELTRENSELQAQVSEQSKVIEHIAKAFNDEKDPMACHEYVDLLISEHNSAVMELHASCSREGKQHEKIAELQAQVNQLREFALHVNSSCANYIMDGKRIDFEKLGCYASDVYKANPEQCLAEVKAQAGRDGFIAGAMQATVCAAADSDFYYHQKADEYANQIRQQFSK